MISQLLELKIPVHETFSPTIQGEGYWTGAIVSFIRLHGCPVGCHFCDSLYADGGKNAPRHYLQIAELVARAATQRVIISGGEPFIHPDLSSLVNVLKNNDKQVHIETSGSFWQEIPKEVWVTLSPKMHLNLRYPVKQQFWARANEIKIVISDGEELDLYQPYLNDTQLVYLQPEWQMRDRTLPLTLELLQQHPNYRLSVQLHKYLNLP